MELGIYKISFWEFEAGVGHFAPVLFVVEEWVYVLSGNEFSMWSNQGTNGVEIVGRGNGNGGGVGSELH